MSFWVFGIAPPAVLLVLVLWLSRPHPRERLGAERSHAAEAEVEEHDIEQMIEARNAIRRRLGKPEIGDEIAQRMRGR